MKEATTLKQAYDLSPYGKIIEIRQKVIFALGVSSIAAFYKYLSGELSPDIEQAKKINAVFLEYGIKINWL